VTTPALPQAPLLAAAAAAHPYPLVFVTLSGAHLYGFASADSDFDLRGSHLLRLAECLGLAKPPETIERTEKRESTEIDLVTHDLRKFILLLLRDNGYVLEQLYSPLVVHTSAEHEELARIARGCITSGCVRHYLGFAHGQWQVFVGEQPRRVKRLLYVYRVLLTGIHMMRSGEVNANLLECNVEEKLSFLPDLVARKLEGGERGALVDADTAFHEAEVARLRGKLQEAADVSHLPGAATCRRELDDYLLRVRLATM
jgi:predicted nucleotidyltransferase